MLATLLQFLLRLRFDQTVIHLPRIKPSQEASLGYGGNKGQLKIPSSKVERLFPHRRPKGNLHYSKGAADVQNYPYHLVTPHYPGDSRSVPCNRPGGWTAR
jgi:hypothetical protein